MAKKTSSEPLSEEKAVKKASKKQVTDDMGEEKKTTKKATRKRAVSVDADGKPVKKATRSRAKSATSDDSSFPVMKAFWGVFNPTMVQVAQYEYFQEKEAQLAAAELTEKKKTPHFVQIIKKLV